MARKPIPLDKLFFPALQNFMKAIKGQSPLACTLIVGASLENALMSLLHAYFIKSTVTESLFATRGALGSFASCRDMAYCLGFISEETYKNLELIGRIRNRFAHATSDIDFADAEIINLCKQIQVPQIPDNIAKMVSLDPDYKKPTDPKDIFTSASFTIHFDIILKASALERQPKQAGLFVYDLMKAATEGRIKIQEKTY